MVFLSPVAQNEVHNRMDRNTGARLLVSSARMLYSQQCSMYTEELKRGFSLKRYEAKFVNKHILMRILTAA